jgi:2-C-methyl-D-erythritol 4-phosphate cytidylyltransferase
VVAAGQGRRFGGEVGKQWVEVAGQALVDWSIALLLGVAERVTVAIPEEDLSAPPSAYAGNPRVGWIAGGASRWQSVLHALDAVGGEADDLVAVHDGARPATAPEDVAAVIAAAEREGAAVLGRAASDTMKRVAEGRIVATVARDELFRAETPQVVRRDLLQRSLAEVAAVGLDPTDESSAVELLSDLRIVAVPARFANPKVTEPGDLELVASLLAARIESRR